MSKNEKNSLELIQLIKDVSIDVSANSKTFNEEVSEILKDLVADGSVSFFINNKRVKAEKKENQVVISAME